MRANNEFIKLSLLGDQVKFKRNKQKGTHMKRQSMTEGIRLSNKRKRTISGILSACSLIKHEPHMFASLIFDRRNSVHKEMNIEAEKKALFLFLGKLCKMFPDGWFLYKCEWSPISLLHFHVVISLDKRKKKIDISEYDEELRTLWQEISKNQNYFRCYKQKVFSSSSHYSYITAKEKKNYDLKLAELFGKSHIWGIRNKHNTGIKKTFSFTLSENEWNVFSDCIAVYHEEHSTSQYYKKALRKTAATISYIPFFVLLSSVKISKLLCARTEKELLECKHYIRFSSRRISRYSQFNSTFSHIFQHLINELLVNYWNELAENQEEQITTKKVILQTHWSQIPSEVIHAHIQAGILFFSIIGDKKVRYYA